jgi:carboxyl-terminal processing protease
MIPAILLFALIHPSPQNSGSTTSPVTKLVAALDEHYLYASGAGWQQTRSVLLAEGAKDGSSVDRALDRLNDPDLRVVTAAQLQVIQQETAGHERGIGLVDFALTSDPVSGEPQIVTALVGSAGYLAGLQPRDTLTAIDGKPTIGLPHEEVMAALRGNSGSVNLTFERGGVVRTIQVTREEQNLEAVLSRRLSAATRPVGYIAI